VADPLKFVLCAFPWEGEDGPDRWQVQTLERIKGAIEGTLPRQLAVASGHGIGKTALTAWLVLWFMTTRPHPQVVVTANTRAQLTGKTWRELAKWHKKSLFQDWFEWRSEKFFHVDHPETWFAQPVAWSKDRAEAFAGTHEQYVLMLFDEASAIHDAIWETAEGAMTTAGALWLAFGNPTRNSGRFRECWGKFRHRWQTQQVDSRTAKMADQGQIQQWITDYGEDSDFVRVRVRGIFPRSGTLQFISEELLDQAQARTPEGYHGAPRVLGADVARYGDDQTVLLLRQGVHIEHVWAYRELNTMQVASRVVEIAERDQLDAIFIDEVGIGAGVVDRVRQLGWQVIGVNAGAAASEPKRYYNLRAEMWAKLREWLEHGGCLPLHPQQLRDDLKGPTYGYAGEMVLQLEKKDDMKARGLASPDFGDSLALTFAQPVRRRHDTEQRRQTRAKTDFNVF
jgi:hypothetical protein